VERKIQLLAAARHWRTACIPRSDIRQCARRV